MPATPPAELVDRRQARVMLSLEAVAALTLLARFAWERGTGGIQVETIGFAVVWLPAHLERWGALRTGSCPVGMRTPGLVALELAALASLLLPIPSTWGAGLGGLAGVWRSVRPPGPGSTAREVASAERIVAACGPLVVLGCLAARYEISWLGAALLTPSIAEAARLVRGDATWGRRVVAQWATFLGIWASRAAQPDVAAAILAAALLLPSWHRRCVAGWSPRARRRALLRLGVPAALLFVILALGEVSLRLVPNPYRDLIVDSTDPGWHKPGGVSRYEGPLLKPRVPVERRNVVRWNSIGFHDVDHDVQKPPGVFRILVLGDSFVEGIQVPLEDLFHRLLERDLAALGDRDETIEVMALGWSGWGQTDSLRALRELGLSYSPDLVLVEFLCANDVMDNSRPLREAIARETTASTWARRAYLASITRGLLVPALLSDRADLMLRTLRGEQESLAADLYRRRPRRFADIWEGAWAETRALVADFQAECAERDVALAFVVFTSPLEFEAALPGAEPVTDPDALDPRHPALQFQAICDALGLPCLDLNVEFAALEPGLRARLHLYEFGDGHWSRDGHEQAARSTARWLVERGLVPGLEARSAGAPGR